MRYAHTNRPARSPVKCLFSVIHSVLTHVQSVQTHSVGHISTMLLRVHPLQRTDHDHYYYYLYTYVLHVKVNIAVIKILSSYYVYHTLHLLITYVVFMIFFYYLFKTGNLTGGGAGIIKSSLQPIPIPTTTN